MAYACIKWYDNFVRIPLLETHMEITEPRRLYQQLAADLKERIEQGVYLVGDKLPAERFIADEKTSAAPWFVKPSSCWKLKAMSKCVKVQVFMWFPTSRAISNRLTIIWSLPITVRLSYCKPASSSKVILPSSRQLR